MFQNTAQAGHAGFSSRELANNRGVAVISEVGGGDVMSSVIPVFFFQLTLV